MDMSDTSVWWGIVRLGLLLLAVRLIFKWLQRSREDKYQVEITPTEIICLRSDGSREAVSWQELDSVEVRGSKSEGFHLLLNGESSGCVVPSGAKGVKNLLSRLKSLPGFDDRAITEVKASKEEILVLCWEKESGT